MLLALLLIASASTTRASYVYYPASSLSSGSSNGNTLATYNLVPPKEASSSSTPSSEAPETMALPTNSTPVTSPPTLDAWKTTPSTPTVLYGVPLVKTYTPVAPPVLILRQGLNIDSRGAYSFEYETANHIAAQESGKQKTPDSSEVQGSYSYLAPNGETISLSYVANENGFRATGDHLPTPPPIPAAILRSLELNAAEEAKGIVNDGQYLPPLVVSPSVATQYLSPASKQETVVVSNVVTPTLTTQYLPAVIKPEAQKVLAPNVITQYLPPAAVGYKY